MFNLIIATTLIIGASAILTAFPSNTLAFARSKVILECRTNTSKKLIWRQRLLNATEKDSPLDVIFTGNRFSNEAAQRYDIIHESDGQFDLKFTATLNHGNEYLCMEPGGDNFITQVIVLVSEPKCYVNGMPVISKLTVVDNEELIKLRCNLTFAGRWRPKMEWTQQIISENEWVVIASEEATEKKGKICFTSTTLGFNATHNVTSFMCTTRFLENDRPKTTTAENIPEYSHNWRSPTFILRSFYETNYRKKEKERKDWNIEFGNKGWVLVSLILCVLLFISISVTISVALHFTLCPKKTQAQNHEDVSLPMRSSLDVDILVTESTAVGAEGRSTSMPVYEEVDITIGNASADNKYSALVKSDITTPEPHNYETINLPEMGDCENTFSA